MDTLRIHPTVLYTVDYVKLSLFKLILTECTQGNCSSTASSFIANQGTLAILKHLAFHYHVYRRQLIAHILIYMNPIHTIYSRFSSNISKLSSHRCPGLPCILFSAHDSDRISLLSHVCHVSNPSLLPWRDFHKEISEINTTWSCKLREFLLSPQNLKLYSPF